MRFRLFAAVALAAGALAGVPAAALALPAPAVTVSVVPAQGVLSYFRLAARPGGRVFAGTLRLSNSSAAAASVTIDPVSATTATALGSAYALRGAPELGSASWIRLTRRVVRLGAHATLALPVYVQVPAAAAAGDHLSGIAVQAVGAAGPSARQGRFEIDSVERYAIGVLVSLPGPRAALIRFSGASVDRVPSGLTFYLDASNLGNVLLTNVYGSALITHGNQVVARVPLGPGTFVNGTSVAYPILVPRLEPAEGTVFRVRALLHYGAATAYLDTLVDFGRASAQRQAQFGGPAVLGGPSHPVWRSAALLVAIALAGLCALVLFFLARRRRRPSGRRAALRVLGRALARARTRGTPFGAIALRDVDRRGLSSGAIASARRHVRSVDRLVTVEDGAVVVLEAGTGTDVANALAVQLAGAVGREDRVVAAAFGCSADTVPEMALRGLLRAGRDAADARLGRDAAGSPAGDGGRADREALMRPGPSVIEGAALGSPVMGVRGTDEESH